MTKQKQGDKNTPKMDKESCRIKREGLIAPDTNTENAQPQGLQESEQTPYEGPSRALKAALDAVENMGHRNKKPH